MTIITYNGLGPQFNCKLCERVDQWMPLIAKNTHQNGEKRVCFNNYWYRYYTDLHTFLTFRFSIFIWTTVRKQHQPSKLWISKWFPVGLFLLRRLAIHIFCFLINHYIRAKFQISVRRWLRNSSMSDSLLTTLNSQSGFIIHYSVNFRRTSRQISQKLPHLKFPYFEYRLCYSDLIVFDRNISVKSIN